MLSNILRLNLCYLKFIHIPHPRYHSKIIGHILKEKQKNKSVCIRTINHNENEDENRSHRYGLNRSRSRHRYKCSKYEKYLSMMMLIRIKQHLDNI